MARLQTIDLVFLVGLSVPSLACLGHMWWRRNARFWQRALWSFVVIVPFIGPLLYASLFSGLSRHAPGMEPKAGQGGLNYPLEPPRDDHR